MTSLRETQKKKTEKKVTCLQRQLEKLFVGIVHVSENDVLKIFYRLRGIFHVPECHRHWPCTLGGDEEGGRRGRGRKGRRRRMEEGGRREGGGREEGGGMRKEEVEEEGESVPWQEGGWRSKSHRPKVAFSELPLVQTRTEVLPQI
jgi:hypothetical protein